MRRNSRIELLRILSILGITAHHMVFHSSIMEQPLGINRLFAQFFVLFGKCGVNLFVLISGYFLVANATIDYKKSVARVLNIWKRVMLYSILLGGLSLLLFRDSVSGSKLLKTVFPTVTGHYWFMTAFIGLMALEPFLNMAAHSFKRADYEKLLVILFLMMAVLPINTWCNDLLWFIVLYFTAGYIRLFDLRYLTTHRRKLFISVACFGLMWLASVLLSILSIRVPAFEGYINYFAFRQNSIFMYSGCIGIFLFVIGLKPVQSKIINQAAKHVLPCYLIQSNVFISSRLWEFVDSMISKQSGLYPLAVAGTVLVLTIAFMGMDVIVDGVVRGSRFLVKRRR